jgi:predicted ester cyclase
MNHALQRLSAAAALFACAATEQPTPPARSPDMTDSTQEINMRAIRSLYDECFNAGALEGLDALVAPDYLGPQGERGPDGFRNTIRGIQTGIPDIRYTIDEVLAAGDAVAVRWTWRGTHTGTLREFAPSQKPVTNPGIALFHLKDGKIVSAAVQTDRLGLLQQIGVIPQDLAALARPR